MYYSKQEMLARARTAGFKTTQSRFEDWMDRGIVGKSVKREYPGRGSVAFWSHAQLVLFLKALEFRQHNHAKIHHLCNLPVWAWLYLGDTLEVPLSQVQDAMYTWVNDVKSPAMRATRKTLQELINMIESPHATDRRAFIEALVTNWEIPEDQLDYYLQSIIDPKGRGEARGPERAAFTVGAMKTMIAVRTRAVKHLEKMPVYLWEWARTFLQFSVGAYLKERPTFASDPDLGYLFKQENLGSLCGEACLDLLTILGIGNQWGFLVGFPAFLQPYVWRTNTLRTIIEPRMEPLPLLQPNGQPFLKLNTHVRVELLVNQ